MAVQSITMYIILLFIIALVGCTSNEGYTKGNTVIYRDTVFIKQRMNFKGSIDTIEKKVIDLTSTSDLFGINEFVAIYENPTSYRDDALWYIADSINSIQKKLIATYTMQGLSDSLYIEFSRLVVDLYEKGSITDDVMEATVFYSINKRYQIIRNYNNPNVVSLFQKIKACTQKVEIKQRINYVLSGESWSNLADFLGSEN